MRRWVFVLACSAILIVIPAALVDNLLYARIISIAGIALLLWLSEAVPPFVPTLVLWALIPIAIQPIDNSYSLARVLGWAADPVMALFFGGFLLGAATDSTGLAARFASLAVKWSRGEYWRFLLFAIFITAFLSMWMSNIAAAALVLASLHPMLQKQEQDGRLRRSLLVGVALGADLGGIATPVGTGPNAIAIAAVSQMQPVQFVNWMAFALPLTVGMLLLAFLYLRIVTRPCESDWVIDDDPPVMAADHTAASRRFIVLFALTVAMWLTEPVHGVPAAVVAIAAAAMLFLVRILNKSDLLRLDWSTLLLIAGGITLGRLLEQSMLVKEIADSVPFQQIHPAAALFILCFVSASLSAVMSNTATAALLVPLAMTIIPSPSVGIIVAISASFGVPFLISTPPNAMAFGEGGLRSGDLFWPGIVIMLAGCALVAFTGPAVLHLAGIG